MSKLGWAGGIGGFSRGIRSGYELGDMIAQRNRAREAEAAFGNVIRDMYGARPPEPMTPDQTSGAPMNVQRAMPTQLSMPNATPMPGAPQGAPGGTATSWPPGGGMPPRQAPMRGAPTAMAPGFETMPQKPSAPQNLTWQAVLGAVAKQFPQGTNPRAMAPVVEKLIPIMNAQSAAEWRELQGRLSVDRLEQGDRRLDQTDRKIGQGDERIKLARDRVTQTKRMADARIQQIQTKNAAAAAAAKLPPQVKVMFDMHQKVFTQTATTMRNAATNLQRARFEGSQENIADAQADYAEAQQAYAAARTEFEKFAATAMPKTKLDLEIMPLPEEGGGEPAITPKSFAPASQTLETGERVITTKTGARAQVGTGTPPQVKNAPVAKQGPASGLDALSPPPARVSATPGGKPTAVPPPAAVEYLRRNPGMAKQFDEKYGAGAAQKALAKPKKAAAGR